MTNINKHLIADTNSGIYEVIDIGDTADAKYQEFEFFCDWLGRMEDGEVMGTIVTDEALYDHIKAKYGVKEL
jgi:hypothetical protein